MNFTFCGCSFTVGVGLEQEKTDISNYANIVSDHFSANIKNIAIGGNSNYNIFMSALNELVISPPDKILIQWTSLNRVWLHPGPDTKLPLALTMDRDYSYKHIFFTKKELQTLSDHYHILNHDYCHLMELISYCKLLSAIAKGKSHIIFINGLLPWTGEICDLSATKNYSENLSKYTKEILEFDSRDDVELYNIFYELNSKVNELDKTQWPNMFDSMGKQKIDIGNDNAHPGPKSHRLYAEMIINYLESTNGN
jgi:hypothetical protein